MSTEKRLTIAPMEPTIGAEVKGVDLAHVTDSEFEAIHAALLKHKVLFFYDQAMTRAQHVTFGRRFGELEVHPLSAHPEYPEILVLDSVGGSSVREKMPAAAFWHTDTTFRAEPSAISILYAYDIPALGGDTVWANTAAAYEGLSDHMKNEIGNLTALHNGLAAFESGLDSAEKRSAFTARYPALVHPVVAVHPETGEPCIYVNIGFTTRILGVPKDISGALLGSLCDLIKRPEYQVRFRWKRNAVAIWDNRATQHYGVADYVGHRHLERVTIVGQRPVGMVGTPVA